jgi:hypothetical protein
MQRTSPQYEAIVSAFSKLAEKLFTVLAKSNKVFSVSCQVFEKKVFFEHQELLRSFFHHVYFAYRFS